MCEQIDQMRPSRLGLGGLAYYSNESNSRIRAYKKYMATIATLLNVTATDTERFVRNTIALERELAKVSERTCPFTVYYL